ncbi:MAG TPA: DUF2934 domain-containing protein [Bryobacteraceae bacterium]|nr:DUF2934 domain-containing protein [Bryobacteraceae bacterium]
MATIEVPKDTEQIPDFPTGHNFAGLTERIQQRAYTRFEQRGCASGHELEDWLEAEREILAEAFEQNEFLICGPDGQAGVPVTGELARVATAAVSPP